MATTPDVPLRRKPRRVTLADVAKIAGVTKNTVSIALHDRPGKDRITEATQARIRAAAKALGYTPNLAARSLTLSRASTIGLFSPRSFWMVTQWSSNVFSGLQQACAVHGLDLLLHGQVQTNPDGGYMYTYGAPNGKVDGLIVLARGDDPSVPLLQQNGYDAVALATRIPGMPSVVDDGDRGMRHIARHLRSSGHTRVLFRDFIDGSTVRKEAFLDEARLLGMEVVVHPHDYAQPERFQPGEEALLALDRADRFTALVGSADHMVYPILGECRRRGWRIPQDLAVTGYDGLSMQWDPPPHWQLTTIRVNWWHAAEVAVGLLVDLMAGRTVPELTVVPVELVKGDTT